MVDFDNGFIFLNAVSYMSYVFYLKEQLLHLPLSLVKMKSLKLLSGLFLVLLNEPDCAIFFVSEPGEQAFPMGLMDDFLLLSL